MELQPFVVALTYFLATAGFVVGLGRLASPRTARSGMAWAGWGMALAVIAAFLQPGLLPGNLGLAALAIAVGGAPAWLAARKVATPGLAGLVPLSSGMGGGAAAAIGAATLLEGGAHGLAVTLLAVAGSLAGAFTFAGGLVAFARLRAGAGGPVRFGGQNQANAAVLLFAVIVGLMLLGDYPAHTAMVIAFFLLALVAGVMFMLPARRADLPVVVAFHAALSGGAVTLQGFVLGNEAMIVAGALVVAAAGRLTGLVSAAAERPVGAALFGGGGGGPDDA